MILGYRKFRTYQKKAKELETFQDTKQEIVYKINQVIDGKELLDKQREIFKKELIEKIESYLLDLPIGDYKVKYNEMVAIRKLKGSENMYVHINISKNKNRSFLDKITDQHKKSISIYTGAQDTTHIFTWSLIWSWEINSILKFHNNLEKIMLTIGQDYGYEPKKEACNVEEQPKTPLIP